MRCMSTASALVLDTVLDQIELEPGVCRDAIGHDDMARACGVGGAHGGAARGARARAALTV